MSLLVGTTVQLQKIRKIKKKPYKQNKCVWPENDTLADEETQKLSIAQIVVA